MVQYRSRVRPLVRHKSIVTRETVRSLKNGYVGRLMFNTTVVVLGKIFGIRACHGSIALIILCSTKGLQLDRGNIKVTIFYF